MFDIRWRNGELVNGGVSIDKKTTLTTLRSVIHLRVIHITLLKRVQQFVWKYDIILQ